MRAVSLCRVGRTEDGLAWAERALELDPEDPGVRYNAACLFSVAGRTNRALDCLEEAVQAGFGNPDWLERDPDLDNLRGAPRFEALLAGSVPTSGGADLPAREAGPGPGEGG